ncbi:LOW QUALITY PROTEIN: fasciclin-like arabinogalactan protein 6 [Durio zibethinus]|uniref:LOW QUALITY PROTEIN: fasciclin-like arabinogalactan protein 6 n=1 Tax=Durio zibethinus TaxID=66656 RepID=A0A6P6ABM5_DURZI|nr:LOW QUALITY PROTEIN: fasciclin-like arabinogalactan protein 6 [Durio zibethinus]
MVVAWLISLDEPIAKNRENVLLIVRVYYPFCATSPVQKIYASDLFNLHFLSSVALFLLFILQLNQTALPLPTGPFNFTGILDKNGQYTNFLRLLADTQVGSQIQNQLNSTSEGFTVFAPTDNAFNNLKAGTINSLDEQQKVQLVLYHVLPKYYSLNDLEFVSNPVRTQATGQDGRVFGLNFTGQNNQINVSTGIVETQINNALTQQKPLAVYQVDKVLLPVEFYEANSPAAAPSPATKKSSAGSNSTTSTADGPAGSGSRGRNMGLGLVVGLALACMGYLSHDQI